MVSRRRRWWLAVPGGWSAGTLHWLGVALECAHSSRGVDYLSNDFLFRDRRHFVIVDHKLFAAPAFWRLLLIDMQCYRKPAFKILYTEHLTNDKLLEYVEYKRVLLGSADAENWNTSDTRHTSLERYYSWCNARYKKIIGSGTSKVRLESGLWLEVGLESTFWGLQLGRAPTHRCAVCVVDFLSPWGVADRYVIHVWYDMMRQSRRRTNNVIKCTSHLTKFTNVILWNREIDWA